MHAEVNKQASTYCEQQSKFGLEEHETPPFRAPHLFSSNFESVFSVGRGIDNVTPLTAGPTLVRITLLYMQPLRIQISATFLLCQCVSVSISVVLLDEVWSRPGKEGKRQKRQ